MMESAKERAKAFHVQSTMGQLGRRHPYDAGLGAALGFEQAALSKMKKMGKRWARE